MAEVKAIKLAKCSKCGKPAADGAKFCPDDGSALFVEPDDGWGRGSDVKRLCKIPEVHLETGELVEVYTNGEARRGEQMLTFAEYEDIMSRQEQRLAKDKESRHGPVGVPRKGGIPTMNVELGSISGHGRRF